MFSSIDHIGLVLLLFLLKVGIFIKMNEETEEEDFVTADPPVERSRKSALVLKDELKAVDGSGNKLGNLAVG